ncbi:MAG: serine hydrolase [Opitutaceae bacterium]|nr:serine hydrolase [Opitutaceae bacterium]
MTSAELAAALILAVQAQHFELTPDRLRDGAPVEVFPTLDLAVIAFPEQGEPVGANVLFSRDLAGGLVAQPAPGFGRVTNVHYLADQCDAKGDSADWLPGANWDAMTWSTLAGQPPLPRFVAPYPASLIKLMVLVGVAREIDAGHATWDGAWAHAGETRRVVDWADAMIVVSNNAATTALVALLHHTGAVVRDDAGEKVNRVNTAFEQYGLPTLQLSHTRPNGGWMNRDGAGLGALQMTAWDTVRLLWLLDAEAPRAPWVTSDQPPLLSPASRDQVRRLLGDQALHEVLSSTVLAGVPGWQPGLPARLPERWITPTGSVSTGDHTFPGDVRPVNAETEVRFAHKTGTTENFLSDAGIVTGLPPARRHYLIALTSNLGTRYAATTPGATTWRIPQLGAAIDRYLKAHLER